MALSRFVNEDRLVNRVKELQASPVTAERRLRDYLARQPRLPKLVSRKRAAEMLGVAPPHLTRIPGLPDPIKVEGGWDAYLKAEIEALARKLERERRKEI